MQNKGEKDLKNLESEQISIQFNEKLESFERELEQCKNSLENLEQNTLKLKSNLNKLAKYCKTLFWLLLGLIGCGIVFLTITPPVVIGLWIIFATFIIIIAIFYYLIKLTFKKFD